jgi:hypothetical protein
MSESTGAGPTHFRVTATDMGRPVANGSSISLKIHFTRWQTRDNLSVTRFARNPRIDTE